MEHLTTAEAECLPQAFAGVIPLLCRDRERLRFAAEITARLDYFEAADALLEQAIVLDDRELLLEAATLCGNPAVDSKVRTRVAGEVGSAPEGRIRFDPDTSPSSVEEQHLYWQCWPGARSSDGEFAAAPAIVLDRSFDALSVLRFTIHLYEAGGSVRRLVPEAEIPMWFGPETVLICHPTTRSRVLSSFPRFSERRIFPENLPDNERDINKLLRRINATLDGQQKLRLGIDISGSDVPDVPTVMWDPDMFTAGVYPTKEAAFLAGTTSSSFRYLHKRGLLMPRKLRELSWNFRDVVAVRTWRYLKSMSPKRVSSSVMKPLAHFAGDSKAVRLGVTSEGNVLADHGDGWVDVETGQSALGLEITEIDQVFRPFQYGGGTVLDLLHASDNTKLKPTVLNGTPHLAGHRISAKALASIETCHQREAIEAYYPELKGVAFEDTVNVGRQLLKAT